MKRHYSFRHRLLLASLSVAALGAGAAGALAQETMTHYTDVEAGAWYEQSASALLESGALDNSEARLRPTALATRAEVMKMLVLVTGENLTYPATPSFDDVPRSAWYYPYVEASARASWVRGDGNCYLEKTHPCTARPADGVNRAEMAALLQRAFALRHTGNAPVFPDIRTSAWYYVPVQTAADHCILQGDDMTGNVRPAALMNRAEMVVMFDRASRNQEYGFDCGVTEPMGEILDVTAASSTRVRVTFSADLDPLRADQPTRFTVDRVGNGSITVVDVLRVSSRVLDLELAASLSANATYRVTASDLRTIGGALFTDSATFNFPDVSPEVSDVSVVSADRIRVTFNTDVLASRADDAFRYTVRRTGETVTVQTATVLSPRVVDLTLSRTLSAQTRYDLIVTDLLSSADVEFSDSMQFAMTEPAPDMTDASATSSTRIRLTFSAPLEEVRAEDPFRYRVMADNRDLAIGRATLLDATTVELLLDESLQTQRVYTVSATNLRTAGGVTFSDAESFLYGSGDVALRATINGAQEVPPVVTFASGTGTFILAGTGLQYDITIRNLSGALISGAHFHRGGVGSEGPILETIFFNGGIRATGTWSDLTAQERDDLVNGRIYVNIHTPSYTDGEIRGQVVQ